MSDSSAPKPRRGFAIASLILGILGLPTVGLALVGAMLGIVLGVVGLVKARNAPTEYGGKGMAVAGIALSVISIVVMPFFLGIIAAIAIPSFLRARVSANESAVIGDVRSVLVAEASYQSYNGGYYDTLECLAGPSRCVPGYSGPVLLEGGLATMTPRHGYKPIFHSGPRPSLETGSKPLSPSSMTAFAYVAVPVQQGRTGVRSFCGDASGEIRAQWEGAEPVVVDGACPADWRPLR
jgi:type II secretory pathway pseudopilin PulG